MKDFHEKDHSAGFKTFDIDAIGSCLQRFFNIRTEDKLC